MADRARVTLRDPAEYALVKRIYGFEGQPVFSEVDFDELSDRREHGTIQNNAR